MVLVCSPTVLAGKLKRTVAHEIRTLRGALYRRIAGNPLTSSAVRDFHQLYFDARAYNLTWRNTHWLGHPVLKCPLDLWLYQEILFRLRPTLIVETGTAFGGSALFLASMCDAIGHGRVVSVDLTPRAARPEHPRIQYLTGSSVNNLVVSTITEMARGASPVMVILDSDHAMAHVRQELEAYHPLVTPGSYLIVEDTNLNGHPVEPGHGPGPMEAVRDFLATHLHFVHDPEMDKFLMSFNPGGFLKRLS